MEPHAILYADRLDLLFENRNKLYGAYPLRKYYSRRLYAAMATVTGFVLIFSCCVIYMRSRTPFSGRIPVDSDHFLTSVTLDPIVNQPVPGKPVRPVKHIATAALTPPLIVKDQPIPEPMATVEELKTASIGVHTEAGLAVPEGDNGLPGASGAGGNQLKDSTENVPAVYDHPDLMPEFPGGPEALKRFLLKNLRMPETELEPGKQVRVIAKFVVGPDGKVSGIETIQSGGAAFDGEVKRVIYRMPDWKPGVQNHKKVAVYFRLPVYFVVPEEN
ncbi:MAG: energy transducer TonB [Bacteroidota bacterium]|nr:energy transducer TonB [Bacteroidota bacterium]